MTARRLAAVSAVVLLAGVGVLAGSASSASQQGFAASANGVGLRATYKNVNDVTGTIFEVSAPIASARVTTDPDSTAFASAPYPGDDIISLINTFGPAVGLPPTAYPLSVSSGYPGKGEASTSAPAGYTLTAKSTEKTSKSSASTGAGAAGPASVGSSVATSDVKGQSGGVAAAVATTDTDSFSVGPLQLSRVASRASADLGLDGSVKLASKMELGDVTVSGQRVGLTRAGLTVAGTAIPLPAGQLTDALKAAGITVTYLAEERTATSVIAPGVLITYKDDQQAETFTLGRAQAAAEPSADGSGAPDLPVDLGGPAVAPPGGGTGTGTGTAVPPGTGVGPAAPVPALDAPQVTEPQGSAPVTSGRLQPAAGTSVPQTFSSGLFYLVLVIAAVAALVAGQLLRILGVRWAS
ncbi:MAG: hypothetical protein ABR549_00725 [Mycobacteriales bacterium]